MGSWMFKPSQWYDTREVERAESVLREAGELVSSHGAFLDLGRFDRVSEDRARKPVDKTRTLDPGRV